MAGLVLGGAAFLTSVATWAAYWPTIAAMRVPLRPVGHQTAMFVSLALGIVAVVVGAGFLGGALAVLGMIGAGMFLFFTLKSGMPHKVPSVGVGQQILDFTAPDAEGGSFDLASLRGAPFLLKFFRGHW